MVDETHISKRTVVGATQESNQVRVDADQPFGSGTQVMDAYYPMDTRNERLPAMIVAGGYRDAGFEKIVGCKFKDMGWSVSWNRLLAASGVIAITYTNDEPERDFLAVLSHVRENATAMGIDEKRMGVLATSGHGPLALSALKHGIQCGVFICPNTLDLDGATHIADAAKCFGFANPTEGWSIDDVPRDVPLFIARAGQDQMPGLNAALDRFVANAIASNLPLTFVNHPTAPHAFDLFDDSDMTRDIVRQILAFTRFQLGA